MLIEKEHVSILTIKKKGGIYIKKILFFLITILSITVSNLIIANAETAKFYEAEYIDEIYINKYQYSTKTIYYQKARFFRKAGTNEYAFCIEPFAFFNESSSYESTLNPRNLTPEQMDRIGKIAYFGYGYQNHLSTKWYAITQFMIWQVADQSGDYYFTDRLNGNRVDYFMDEINEINYLVDSYNNLPSFANKTITTVKDWNLTISDNNNVLNYYTTKDQRIKINGNSISFDKLDVGEYEFSLSREENKRNKPIIFYQSNNSQNLMKTGDIGNIETNFKIKVVKTKINIIKIDKDTLSITPSGDAILDGAKYVLYNDKMKEIKQLEIKDNEAQIENLYFGKYYLKEVSAGDGYTLDTNTYEINLTEKSPTIDLQVKNEVIKKKITIIKKYGDESNFNNEENIEFDIFNKNFDLIKTIKTNSEGIAEVTLPYGEYTIVQKNTTTGYNKIEPFKIKIADSDDEVIELKDYKIPVPNTSTNAIQDLFTIIFKIVLLCIC